MSKPRMLFIGLDSVSWEYLNFYLSNQDCPNLSRLILNSTCHTLKSGIPPMTPAAWPKIYFGAQAKHLSLPGWERIDQDYKRLLVTATDYRRVGLKYFWEYLFRSGVRTGLVNLPYTFPASEETTFQLSGFDGPFYTGNPTGSGLCFPDDLLVHQQLEHYSPFPYDLNAMNRLLRGFSAEADYDRIPKPSEIEQSLRNWIDSEEQKTRLAIRLHNLYETEFLAMYFFSCDYFSHKFPMASPVMRQVFQHIDHCVGILLQEFDILRDHILVLSDHGQIENSHYFYISNFLETRGYLRYKSDVIPRENFLPFVRKWFPKASTEIAEALYRVFLSFDSSLRRGIINRLKSRFPGINKAFDSIEWLNTRLFYFSDYGQIYINDTSRFRQGKVSPQDRQKLFEQVRDELSEFKNRDGVALFHNFQLHDCLSDDYRLYMPDITFEIADYRYYILDDSKKQLFFDGLFEDVTENSYKVGDHTDQGILIMNSVITEKLGFYQEGIYNVEDIAGFVFSLYDITPTYGSDIGAIPSTGSKPLSDEELKEKIRRMGYKI